MFRCESQAAQVKQELENQQQTSEDKLSEFPPELSLKGLEQTLSYHLVQPYPFTFISAVKRKLASDDASESCRKHEPNKNAPDSVTILNSDNIHNLHEIAQKMDFIKSLKVPDSKISKKLDYSNRENSASKELIKFEAPGHERTEKPTKNFERVQRRLDFSTSDVSSTNNSEIEPLKVPNISISSHLSKKKEYVRENSREKENRSKKIRKDDGSKQDEMMQDIFKRSRSPRHSRKEFPNPNELGAKLKNDRLLFNMPRESDFGSKPKPKNLATTTAKKVNDKRRSVHARSLKSRDTSLDSKNRSYSNESLSSAKLSEKVTVRESRFENFDYRYKDDLKQIDDQKHIFSLDTRQGKQHKACPLQTNTGNTTFKEQLKRSEKVMKPSTSKIDGKLYMLNSKETESVTDSNVSARTQSPTISSQLTKNKDPDKIAQSISVSKSSKTEDSKYIDNSLTQSTSGIIKKEEEDSFTQSVTTTAKQTSNSNESNLNDSSLSSALLDPRRISFRDESRSPQEEFCDLVTPDVNLLSRSKRKRQFIQNNVEEVKCSKHCTGKSEVEQECIPLLHPTALHMQFQAELHLLDSFNESLRQVMDVEKCLYNVKQEQEKELPLQHSQSNDQVKSHFPKGVEERNIDDMEHRSEISKLHKLSATEQGFPTHHITSQTMANELESLNKIVKPTVKAVEVQTQTVNDMATQTDIRPTRRNVQSRCSEVCGVSYERGFAGDSEVPQLSLDSVEQFEDLDQVEEISLPSKLRTMSEISLHETTSSIRTETGTEISISTRDVTCSFNKYLDLEIAQLIKDEKQRYDKIEMLFKSREKTLNDRTKKLVKLEEQKRALRDTGQESRVSSVKKKQRALLLKLQQEKDEMNRLKELHKIASQERKLMLQKQRNMFNPQMSTKNILTKLKRSADSQSPRRLSGPMKGYDIRSNSSMSSLVDSDKSQHDRSQTDARLQMSESELIFSKSSLDLPRDKFANFVEGSSPLFLMLDKSDKSDEASKASLQEKCPYKRDGKSKYEIKSRKFEEKMPKADTIRLKSQEPKLISNHSVNSPGKYLFEKEKSNVFEQNLDKSISEHVKSESDTLVEELSKKSKPSAMDHYQSIASPREIKAVTNTEVLPEEISSASQDTVSKTSKSSQVSEDVLQTHSKSSKRSSKSIPTDKEEKSKKTQYSESKSNLKRRSSKCQKSKSSSSILTENILRSKSSSQVSEELRHHNKRTKTEKEFIQFDKNDENMDKHIREKNFKLSGNRAEDFNSKENMSCQMFENIEAYENFDDTKSQISNFAVSHHSSESDRNYSKSVVIRSQDHNLKTSKKLEQILNAREAALTSRKNCVEEWMAWHAKLRTEEDRVARMEQAAFKLVTATSNVFSQQDTTVSSDTSDIEGRIELLTEKLAERRIEMSRLKREARKQTKQKLRALEANLLNQIKKYDTTIHEMRKKLESKKTTSKDSKLAIESRSLADFKVPEIPLKKIQDIFRSSDLSRSRSESDLLSTKRPSTKDSKKKPIRNETVETEDNSNHSEKLIKSSKNLKTSEQSIAQSVLDDSISEQIEIDKLGSISSISDEIRSEKNVPYGTKQNKQDSKKNSMSEDVRSEISEDILSQSEAKSSIRENAKKSGISDARSEISEDILTQSEVYEDLTQTKSSKRENARKSISEDVRSKISEDILSQTKIPEDLIIQTKASKHENPIQSDFKEYKSDFDTFSEQSAVKTISSESLNKIQAPSQISKVSNNLQSSNASEIVTESRNESLDKKLDFLRLNNQNLNEDISSLENELKILSEMMSRFNKQPNGAKYEQNEEKAEERSTSKDVSEILSASDKNEVNSAELSLKETEISQNVNDIKLKSSLNDNKNIVKEVKSSLNDSKTIIPLKEAEISQNSNDRRLKSNLNDSKSIIEEVDNVISAIIPNKISLSRSNSQEIDYKARSKEILNEIEKSIMSEHISDINRSEIIDDDSTLYEENETEVVSAESSDLRKSASAKARSKEILSEIEKSISEHISDINRSEIIDDRSEVVDDNLNLYEENETNDKSAVSWSKESTEPNISLSNVSPKSLQNRETVGCIENIENCLESNRNSSVVSEKSNLFRKENQYTDNLIRNDSSVNESDRTEGISKEAIVAEYMNKLLSKQISPKSSSSIRTLEDLNIIDYMKDRSMHDETSKADFQLILKEFQEYRNDTSFMQAEDIKSKEVSQKSDEFKQEGICLGIEEKRIQSEENVINQNFNKNNNWNTSEPLDIQDVNQSFSRKSHCEDSRLFIDKHKLDTSEKEEKRIKLQETLINRTFDKDDDWNTSSKDIDRSFSEKSHNEDLKLSAEGFKQDTFEKEHRIQTEENVINRTFNKNDDWNTSSQDFNQSFLDKSHSGDSKLFIDESSQSINESKNENDVVSNTENVPPFIPKFTNIDEGSQILVKLNESVEETEEILNVIVKKNNEEKNQEEDIEYSIESDDFQKVIHDSVTKILDKVEKSIEEGSLREKFLNRSKTDLKPTVDEGRKLFSPVIQEKSLEEDFVTEEALSTDKTIEEEIVFSEKGLTSSKIHSNQAGVDGNLQISDKVEKSIEENSLREKFVNRSKNELQAKSDEERKLFSPTTDEGRSLSPTIQQKSLEIIVIEEVPSTEEEIASNKLHSTENLQISDEVIKEDSLIGGFVNRSKETLRTKGEGKSFSRTINIQEKCFEDVITEEVSIEEHLSSNKIHTTQPNINVNLRLNICEPTYQGIIITEVESDNTETESLPELKIDPTIELTKEELNKTNEVESQERIVKEQQSLEPVVELDSSDGEQLDNLVEVAESRLDIIEKKTKNSLNSVTDSESLSHDKTDTEIESEKNSLISLLPLDEIKAKATNTSLMGNKAFDIIKDPEYEDISEESLEVSEIFDKSEHQKVQKASLIERYEAIQKSEEVLKILDEITQRSNDRGLKNSRVLEDSEKRADISDKSAAAVGDNEEDISRRSDRSTPDNFENEKSKTVTPENQSIQVTGLNELDERQEQDVLSESSEGRDTPKGVSEIEMDSPRELNDSRLDIELLNDDLLSNANGDKQADAKDTFHATPIVATTEKDIEVMIDKLKASLEQPRVEDADWEAKLLRIEQLQIELEIKKLEAEEVSYYVREIPNKPPPPYTPPGGGARISTSLGSPSPPPAVIPSNTEELTAFTEKATAIIFRAKEAGEDIMTLEAPPEICELTKENDETVKKDRRIYNAFLFDLCKETIAEVYQAEYEKPGPSWTKPNVKTKPTMKIPKTIDELNAYVNKEVATLFGFKTKLQRENMVMRWSRKRRDRVDELLAREAQAEEDEWTKFHHDELAVKNGLTVTILDTLLMETVNVVKVAYAKKRKIFV
ncbi:centrosome-associated protein 350-like isoform X3 [Ceratina calcarata]|uniref:Centrosome-associated protein 350-like isoform X3 n=1 Tax=Ceratina calcarata TaxID=156304 RepID=A0AAJ7S2S9_9HYME|nr:centrosome-associated protein 350-like isoform X3 [Ceratina calcarata]